MICVYDDNDEIEFIGAHTIVKEDCIEDQKNNRPDHRFDQQFSKKQKICRLDMSVFRFASHRETWDLTQPFSDTSFKKPRQSLLGRPLP